MRTPSPEITWNLPRRTLLVVGVLSVLGFRMADDEPARTITVIAESSDYQYVKVTCKEAPQGAKPEPDTPGEVLDRTPDMDIRTRRGIDRSLISAAMRSAEAMVGPETSHVKGCTVEEVGAIA